MQTKISEDIQYSEFPESEYRDRYKRLVEQGIKQGIDGFVFTVEENLRYFAGGPLSDAFVLHTDYMAVIIPTDMDKPPRFVLSESRVNSTRSSWIKDKDLWGGSIESAGDVTINTIVDSIRDLGLSCATVAMEIDGHQTLFMPASVYDGLRQHHPEMRIVSSFPALMAIKAIKSPLEIECLRKACRITTEAIEHGFSIIRAGTTEKEICRTIKSRMYQLAADSVPFLSVIAGWEGRSICWDSHATDYAIKPGDPIQIDGGCAVNGYVSDMVRTASLGPINNARYLELYDVALRAHVAVRETLRPGVVIGDVCEAGRQSIIDDGCGHLLVYGGGQTGHGIGVNLHEEPFLVNESRCTLEPGMVLAVEPAILENPDVERATYFTIVENNYLITETGYEQLTTSPNEIRVV
jgi:Xaa-Pro dipeptidase